jgi:checkpoint serine/threonine-protein kinase
MGSDDLIDFEVIENQKENIQSLPSGRSARALAQLYTPPLTSAAGQTRSPSQMQDEHSATRLGFEKELMAIDDSDDPLDVSSTNTRTACGETCTDFVHTNLDLHPLCKVDA